MLLKNFFLELELSRFQDIIVLSDIKLDSYQKTGLLFRFYASYISVSDSRGQNFADCASHMRRDHYLSAMLA